MNRGGTDCGVGGGGGNDSSGTIAKVSALFVTVFPNDPEAPAAVRSNTVSGIAVTIAVDTVKFAVYFATPFM